MLVWSSRSDRLVDIRRALQTAPASSVVASPSSASSASSCSICPEGSIMEGGSNPFLIANSTELPTCQQVEQSLVVLPGACDGLLALEGLVDVPSMCGCTGYEQPPRICSFCPTGSTLINNETIIGGSVTCAHAYLLTAFVLDTNVCPSADYYLTTCCSNSSSSSNVSDIPNAAPPSTSPVAGDDSWCSICPNGTTLGGASNNTFLVSPLDELWTCQDVQNSIPSDPETVCSFLAPLEDFISVAAMCGCSGHELPPNVCTFCPSGRSLTNHDMLINGTITCERFSLLTPFLLNANDCPVDDESVVATCCTNETAESPNVSPTNLSASNTSTRSSMAPTTAAPAPAILVPTVGVTPSTPARASGSTTMMMISCREVVAFMLLFVVVNADWMFFW